MTIGPFGDAVTLALETRGGKSIANTLYKTKVEAGDIKRVQDFRQQYPNVVHRSVGPSRSYNCHGLTFGSRRTGIYSPSDVSATLCDDGYRLLRDIDPLEPGDVAIYKEKDEISHSGIVMYVTNGIPWILSKWGIYHEAIHKPMDCPYKSGAVVYYRLEK